MLTCPHLDWWSDEDDSAEKQVAALLIHYDETHGEGLPEDARELIRACARLLNPAGVQS